jgi:hypothetical protein
VNARPGTSCSIGQLLLLLLVIGASDDFLELLLSKAIDIDRFGWLWRKNPCSMEGLLLVRLRCPMVRVSGSGGPIM